jgi:predicted RNA-binding Zn-ribbon protein involved in translation (DUF1610 family)
MAKSKKEQFADLVMEMDIDELNSLQSIVSKLIDSKLEYVEVEEEVEEDEAELLKRRLLELRNSRQNKKSGSTSSRRQSKRVARHEPMSTAARVNKFKPTNEFKEDSKIDKALFNGKTERFRPPPDFENFECCKCGHEDYLRVDMVLDADRYVCDKCILQGK